MELLRLVSFVKRGKNRKKVFLALDKPMMPSELVIKIYRKNSNSYFNIVSRALTELKENNLVKVVNPQDKTGRIYQRSREGKLILKSI